MTRAEARTYLVTSDSHNRLVALHKSPQTDSVPVEGVFAGRIVAYWPTEDETKAGRYAIGLDGYIPAMIVGVWSEVGSMVPTVQLHLFLDPCNQSEFIAKGDFGVSSCMYSVIPAQRCWTWIPKA